MQCTFEHLSGSKKGTIDQVEGERITFGRNPTNAVAFDPQQDLDVSGDHAQLMVGEDGKYHITDLNSRNGTFLNGTKIAGTVPVEPGSKIQFGKGGPELKVVYTPAAKKAGATRVMLAQVQQQMDVERTQAAQSKKKMMIVIIVVLVLGVVGFLTYALVSSRAAKKNSAMDAQTAAAEMGEKAKRNKANLYAAADFEKARQLEELGAQALEAGDWEGAKEKFIAAKKGYDEAADTARDQMFMKQQEEAAKRAEEAEQRAREAAEQQLAAMKAEQDAREGELRRKEEERLRKLKAEMDKASAAERARMQQELDRLSKKPDSELAREIITKNEPSICYIYVESFVQPKGTTARSVIAKSEGTGFVIAPNVIATAKHVIQPWKYDAKVLATAKKIKEEHQLEVQDYVEIHMGKEGKAAQPFDKKFDTASGKLKIFKVMPDKKVAKAEPVQIEWNQALTVVPDIRVHERNVDDLALLKVEGGELKPSDLANGAPQKFDAVIVLGTVRETAGKRLITASPARAEVQSTTDQVFSLNATVPATFGGCPVFKYDGKIWGVVAGTEGSNLICLPVDRVLKLKGGGGGSTATPGGGLPPGQDPGAGSPGGAAPEEDE